MLRDPCNDIAKRLDQTAADQEMMASEHENDRELKRPRGRFRSWMRSPLVVAVFVGLAACSSPEEKARVRFDRGLAAQARGAHTEAVIELRGALRDDPNRAETHYRLALSLLEIKQFGPGVWELDEAIRLDPKNLDARIRRAWIALATQNPDAALAQATAILDADPSNVDAALARIAAHLSKGNLPAAEAESETAVERWPEEKRAHYDLAQVRSRQGRINDARASLLRYRELDGNSVAATREVVRFYLATEQSGEAESLLRESIPSVAAAERSDLALDLAGLLERLGRDAEAEQVLRSALEAAPERLDLREQLANVLARTGRLDEALAETRAGLALDPSSRALRLQEADALLRRGDLDGASERIRSMLAEHPEDATVALVHARALSQAARTDEAIEVLRGIVAGDPNAANAHYLLGALLLAKGRPADAVGSLQLAAARLSAKTGAPQLFAEALLRLGDFGQSASEARRALEADPQSLRARMILAEALLGSGAATEAESVLRAATEDSAALHAMLARVLVARGRLADAQAEIERARALEPDSVQWTVDLIWILVKRGAGNAALERAETGMLEHPAAPDFAFLKGQILLRLGDEAAAARAFERAIEVDPDFLSGYVNLAQIEARAGRFDGAREFLRRALARRADDADTLRALGDVELRGGRADDAIAAYEKALLADPGSPVSKSALARALADAGRDLDRALDLARAARESDASNADFAEALGRVLHRKGIYAAAVDQFRNAVELLPHPIAAYRYRLGLALLANGDRAGAVRELEQALAIDPSFEGSSDARRVLEEARKTKGESG